MTDCLDPLRSVQPEATSTVRRIRAPQTYGSYAEFILNAGEIVRRIEIAVSMEVYRRPMREDVRQLACLSAVVSWRLLPLEPKRQFGYLKRVVHNESIDHREHRQSQIDTNVEDFPARGREVLERLSGTDRITGSVHVTGDFLSLYDALTKVAVHDPEGVQILVAREAHGATWKELEQQTGKRRKVLRRRLARVKKRIQSDHPYLRALID